MTKDHVKTEHPAFISFIEQHRKHFGGGEADLAPIAPDGSQRSFFRVSFAGGPKTYIAVKNPPSTPQSRRENTAYLRIGTHLRDAGVPVPEIHGADLEKGWFLLEDFGDLRLQGAVERQESPLPLYTKVLRELLKAQIKGAEGFDTNWCCQTPFYDRELMLQMESGYFLESFLRGYLHMDQDLRALEAPLEHLAATAARGGKAFLLHRDFQSRNIMVQGGLIGIIDWQGARLGPLGYDVASLLVDPYSSLTVPQRDSLVQAYAAMLRDALPGELSRFEDTYPYLAIQRNLQILGAFSFLSTRRDKPWFRTFIPPAVDSLLHLIRTLGDPRLLHLEQLVSSLPRPWERPRGQGR